MIPIKECQRYLISEDGKIWDTKRNRFIPQSYRSKTKRYKCVTLNTGNGFIQRNVHRLVAEAFIPNPYNLPQVNHKDENPENNHKDNLEWCDAQYNNTYGNRLLKSSLSQKNRRDCSKPVLQYDKNGDFIARYPSVIEAERQTNISNSHISAVCNHKPSHHTAGGFIWKWEDTNHGRGIWD